MAKIIIDGQGAVFGRLCSFAAKKSLEGDEIIIVNSEKVIMTGNKADIIAKYKTLRAKGGHSQKGPKYDKVTYKMLKKGIRGMLPDHRRGIGREAFKKIKCFDGVPKELETEEKMQMPGTKHDKFIELKELSEKI